MMIYVCNIVLRSVLKFIVYLYILWDSRILKCRNISLIMAEPSDSVITAEIDTLQALLNEQHFIAERIMSLHQSTKIDGINVALRNVSD